MNFSRSESKFSFSSGKYAEKTKESAKNQESLIINIDRTGKMRYNYQSKLQTYV
jgi:hypothetical protein